MLLLRFLAANLRCALTGHVRGSLELDHDGQALTIVDHCGRCGRATARKRTRLMGPQPRPYRSRGLPPARAGRR